MSEGVRAIGRQATLMVSLASMVPFSKWFTVLICSLFEDLQARLKNGVCHLSQILYSKNCAVQ